jgi:UV DNA damage endonuclease
MKIGYPCINNSIPRNAPSTFRLASYSEGKLVQTVKNNLIYLNKLLRYNVKNELLFFRISSDIIPFASHPICKFAWYKYFQSELLEIGDYIKKYNIRISMHPDQFIILNSPSEKIVQNSINELRYHCMLLDVMHLDETAKVQIHIGGVYGIKMEAIDRFIKTYNLVGHSIKKRLIIENDDHLYTLRDCLYIHQQTGIPILFDSFHHECYNNGESLKSTLRAAMATWDRKRDGLPMVDYSSQDMGNEIDVNNKNRKKGRHAQAIDLTSFEKFLNETAGLDFDVMLEIKDKEKSALKALCTLKRNN